MGPAKGIRLSGKGSGERHKGIDFTRAAGRHGMAREGDRGLHEEMAGQVWWARGRCSTVGRKRGGATGRAE
eukprot:4904926-Pyramimonas_sp.AAC.1